MPKAPNLYEQGVMAGLAFMEYHIRCKLSFDDEQITREAVTALIRDCKQHLLDVLDVKPCEDFMEDHDKL